MSWRRRWNTIRRVGPTQVALARGWNAFKGDERARKSLTLMPDCLVFDVGAYQGEFTAMIRQDWNARVMAFEPIPEFATALVDRFSEDASVTVLQVALGASDGTISISLAEDGSSAWADGSDEIEARQMDVAEVLADQEAGLLKINAEGAEFDILERLLETGKILQVGTIQVQFHRFVPRAQERRRSIRQRLKASHRCAWNVPWVWEQWVRRGELDCAYGDLR